jgi:DNA-binding NarL/FixJ family response regulator
VRCLLVDDNVGFLEEAQRTLQREGISVVGVARTGAEASTMVVAHRVELLLLDIDLGKESGLDLLKRLADESLLGCARVILISTHAEADFAELIEASAAVGFISKADLSARAIYEVLRAPP